MPEMKMKDFNLVWQLERELMLVEITPKEKYVRNEETGKNERTGEIEGYNYEVLMKDKKHKSIKVTILGNKPIISQDEIDKGKGIMVKFEGLTCNPYP